MKRDRLFIISATMMLGLLAALLTLLFPTQAVATAPTAVSPTPPLNLPTLDPQLQQQLATANPNTYHRVIVHLHNQADLAGIATLPNREDRHRALVAQLQTTAVTSQKPLLPQLHNWQETGLISAYRPFWIINAIAISGTASAIYQLAETNSVAHITPDHAHPLLAPPTLAPANWDSATSATAGEIPWGIQRIQAPHVWHGLGISGTGVTVAIMDSGVAWQHPDLWPNYRGLSGDGSVNHAGHWYNAPDPSQTVPFDNIGHGTHVAGTAVGQNGLGVAPGARWIAANIATNNGLIYNSAVHAAFEWLLAPNGDTNLAPDIINGSWSGPAWLNSFSADIEALHLAGILTVFAAGNRGPDAFSVGSPANLSGVIAAGASDQRDVVAWFSSRGPSTFSDETKPLLVAPGTQTYSALPGGAYGLYNGTSMAAPHVSGAAALLLAANPTLTRPEIARILTETAVSLQPPPPNTTTGWGRLNIYAAVGSQSNAGQLQGIVSHQNNPLPGVIVTITTPSGAALPFQTDENGRYHAHLQPGSYQVATAPFGYQPTAVGDLVVSAGSATTQDLELEQRPSGALRLTVRDAATQAPLSATLTILGAPVTQTGSAAGIIDLILPVGTYNLRLSRTGYRLAHFSAAVTTNAPAQHIVNLTPDRRILLVDSGHWYYASAASYYQESLVNLGHAHDYWPIHTPFNDDIPNSKGPPTADDLQPYDLVIWSAPADSPGYIDANDTITNYLGAGGNLLISGQAVGYNDGYGFYSTYWWLNQLQARFVAKTAVTHTISGAPGTIYEGLTFGLNGPDSAGNQTAVDIARPRPGALTDAIFNYDNNQAAGLQADECRPYHLTYLGFGLEGVSAPQQRDDILARTLDYFQTPPTVTDGRWQPVEIDDFAPPDSQLIYALRLQNLSETLTDTFRLESADAPWPLTFSAESITIPSCETAVVTLTLTVPPDALADTRHHWSVTAVSQNDPTRRIILPVQHKTPGAILLVDDDRWYNQESDYQAALQEAGFDHDYWEIGWSDTVRGSPPGNLLNAYDFVIWYTAYDWFRPITAAENKKLVDYLDQGGRLFLSSQDFLYYNFRTPLAQQYFGVQAYQESITPTQVYRGHPALPATTAGPLPLIYPPFQNFSDGLIPRANAQPFLWHDQGMMAGIAHSGPAGQPRPFRTIFWSVPLEKTPVAQHTPFMVGIVGWLSDLGDSTFVVDRPVGVAGATRHYTLTLRNNHDAANQVAITNSLPAGLHLHPASLSGGAFYDPVVRQITWSGELPPGGGHIISYQATPAAALPAATRLENEVTLSYGRHDLSFTRQATLWLNTPDLHASALTTAVATHHPWQFITYTLTLSNAALVAAPTITADLRLPDSLTPLTHTLAATSGAASLEGPRLAWQTALPAQAATSVTLVLSRALSVTAPEWLSAAAYIDDGRQETLIRSQITHLPPYQFFTPIISFP